MNLTTARRYRIALAALALTGLCCGTAGAATVRGAGTGGMDHWYGRAGGLAGSDSVNELPAWQKSGQPVEVGVPANSGSLYFNEAKGGFFDKANVRSNEGPVGVGLPANSGSLYFNEAQGGIRSKPSMRSYGENETGQSAASAQQEPASSNEH